MAQSTRAAAVLAALAAAGVVGAATAAPAPQLKSPDPSRIGEGPVVIPDAVLDTRSSRRLQDAARWGGQYTASTGDVVTVYASDAYPQDPSLAQRWADFLAGLVHGSELSTITLYLAPLAELQSICGKEALGCYDDRQHLLVAPGDDPAQDVSAEAVVTHEYGHHVAANRLNPPWSAIDYGTKRWATYEQVCSRTAAGQLFPGAETLPHYTLNPGEAFAETYRVLNERKANLPEPAWDVVDPSLQPDDTALALLDQDVTSPWTASTLRTVSGSFGRYGSATRQWGLGTPLDGTVRVTVHAPKRLRLTLALRAGGTTVAHAAKSAAATSTSVSTTTCGRRPLQVAVTRRSGTGPVSLTISTP